MSAATSADCEAHFNLAVQFYTIVTGDVTASSATMFIRNRPSGATAYCAQA